MQCLSSSKFGIFMHFSYSTNYRKAFSLSMQYSLFCPTIIFLYDEVHHQKRSEYNPLIFGRNYTLNI